MRPENRARLNASIEAHEERRRRVYRDSRGNLTIGLGHLVEFDRDIPLTDAAIDAIRDGDVVEMERRCAKRVPGWDELDEVRRAACIEMAFNGSLFASPKALAAIAAGDYIAAKCELLDGPWKSQVGIGRAETLSTRLATGRWA